MTQITRMGETRVARPERVGKNAPAFWIRGGEAILREAVKLRTDSLPKEHYWVALAQRALGECLTMQARFAEAEPWLRESYKSLLRSQGVNNPRTALARQRLAALYEAMGRPVSADEFRVRHF